MCSPDPEQLGSLLNTLARAGERAALRGSKLLSTLAAQLNGIRRSGRLLTMKIAPTTERWNEGERDWSFVKDPRKELESWEAREGLLLPDPYRTFMLRYNGGHVYPRIFRTEAAMFGSSTPYPASDETYVDRIHSWTSVESHWFGETYGPGAVPADHLLFADTPGYVQLLMAVRGQDRGKIYAWIHTRAHWGTEGNTYIFPLADGFSEFMNSLYDDADRSGYKAWRTPARDRVARDLVL
jgi:hypothetical protein